MFVFTFSGLKLWVKSLHPRQYVVPGCFLISIGFIFDCQFFMLYNVGRIFITTLFNAFVIIEWFDLNSDSNSLFEILSIKDFLVDFLICLYFIYDSKNFKNFFIRINFNKHRTKFFFCCSLSLYFIVNISIIMT